MTIQTEVQRLREEAIHDFPGLLPLPRPDFMYSTAVPEDTPVWTEETIRGWVIASHWQPVETIPQDGTRILAYWPLHPLIEDDDGDEVTDTSKDLGGLIAVTAKNGDGWLDPDYLDATGAWFGDDCCYAGAPTFWMPLPPAPNRDSPALNPVSGDGMDQGKP